MIKSFCFTGV